MKSELENVPKRVLVVDDEVDVNSSLRIILQTSGFEVDTYQDPILALKNFKADTYALLILDIKMPELNGFELYIKLKSIDNKVKVFFLTALADLHAYNDYRKQVFPKEGERYFIAKPINDKNLLDRIKEVVMEP